MTVRIAMTAGTDYPYIVVNASTGARIRSLPAFTSYTAAERAALNGFYYVVA